MQNAFIYVQQRVGLFLFFLGDKIEFSDPRLMINSSNIEGQNKDHVLVDLINRIFELETVSFLIYCLQVLIFLCVGTNNTRLGHTE